MATTGHETEAINVQDLKAALQKLKTDKIDPKVDKTTTVNGHALSSNVTVTKSDVGLKNVTNDAQVKRSEMGAASGVATLDSAGKVPASQLPSYVDDVLEYDTKSAFPTTGEAGKIYVDKSTNTSWRWSGTAYVQIKGDLAIGTTTGTAADGGVANTHYNNTSNPHSVTKAQVGLGSVVNTGDSATPVSGGTTKFTTGGAYTELNKKVDKVSGKGLSTNDYTTDEKNKLSGIASGAEVNQNAFSNVGVKVGNTTTTVAADAKTDTVTLIQGSNVTLTADTTNDTVTIAATDTKYTAATAAPGKVASASAQGSSTNYARQDHTHGIDLATGDSNGQVKIAGTNVSVKGLGSAAYTASSAYAVSQQLASDANLNDIKTVGFYNAGGGNTITNKPSGVEHFGMEVIHYASGAYYVQIVYNNSGSWRRRCDSGTWGSWVQDKLTDTTYSAATTTAAGLMSADDKTKLNGIAAGAEVNVQSDWNATSGDAFIKNKPTIPAAAANGTYTVKTLVGSTTTNVSDFTANQSSADDVTFVQGSNVTITPDTTNRKITIAAKDTTYGVVSTSANGLAPKVTDTSKFLKGDGTWATPTDTNNRRSFYGTCDTAADTAAKAVTLSDTSGWELKAGTIVGIKFTNTNSASNVTLNVNNSGAKSIWYNNAAYTGNSNALCGSANRVNYYMYDGTYWVWLNMGTLDGNTDTKVAQTVTTTSADYEVLFSNTADNTTRTEGARKNSNLKFNPSTGNLQATQLNGVTIGSSPKFTDTTYSSKSAASGGTDVSLVTTGEKYTWNSKTSNTGTVTKVTAGTGLTGGDITTTGTIALATSGVTAGTYKRVTVDAYGRVTSGDNTDSDTKNTAGTTNKTGTKMFLAAATEQGANPQTYSNSNCYIGTDNCLYSGGAKVLTAHDGNNRKAFYGTCTTAAATKDKVVTLAESAGWPGLVAGVIVGVKFTNTNTYSSATANPITLNVNSTGAKNIWFGNTHSGAGNTGTNTTAYGRANYVNYYMYDGTYWAWLSSSADNNTTYSPLSLGFCYGECSTAAGTAAKTVTMGSYNLVTHGIVSIRFTNAITVANATLNINSKGAKAIYYKGAALGANIIGAGSIVVMQYNGSQYQIVSIEAPIITTSEIDELLGSD